MYKNYKRFTSLLIVFAMALVLFMPSAASAAVIPGEDTVSYGSIYSSDSALYSIRGSQLSPSLYQNLTSYGLDILQNTLLEIVPADFSENSTALIITNTDGTYITKDTVLAFEENGDVGTFISQPSSDIAICSTTETISIDPIQDGSVLVTLRATYNKPVTSSQDFRYNYFFQPVNIMFKYQDPANAHTFSRIYLDYFCQGYEHYYPSLEAVSPGPDTFTHSIIMNRTGAVSGVFYTKTNAYRTDRVINTYSGNASHAIDFQFTIDGRIYKGTCWVTQL